MFRVTLRPIIPKFLLKLTEQKCLSSEESKLEEYVVCISFMLLLQLESAPWQNKSFI